MIMNAIAGMVYKVVMVYIIFYFVHSFSAKLPWTHCDNPWNTANCKVSSNESGMVGIFLSLGLFQLML